MQYGLIRLEQEERQMGYDQFGMPNEDERDERDDERDDDEREGDRGDEIDRAERAEREERDKIRMCYGCLT